MGLAGRKGGPGGDGLGHRPGGTHGPGIGIRSGTRHSALLHSVLAQCEAGPDFLGRLHSGGLLPPAHQGPRRRARPQRMFWPTTPPSGVNWCGQSTWFASGCSEPSGIRPLTRLSIAATDHDLRHRDRLELGEILEAARRAVLSPRQDRIVELWMRGWTVPEIGAELAMPSIGSVTRSTRPAKTRTPLASRCEELGIGPVAVSADWSTRNGAETGSAITTHASKPTADRFNPSAWSHRLRCIDFCHFAVLRASSTAAEWPSTLTLGKT